MGNITKRGIDIIGAVLGLLVLAPIMIVIAALVRSTSPGPVLFRQSRIGRNFRPFIIYKFRTMFTDAHPCGPLITADGDPRVTPIGRTLRFFKLDELPQLFNVLIGDMSFVGPRPEVLRYVELFRSDYQEILRLRPGITDLASITYRHESELLALSSDPEVLYVEELLPKKIALAKDYARRASPIFDLYLIFRTALVVCGLAPISPESTA
jgi:lipopolysaccharide/colanic/teichoic acid biosynthesis glycosyltransferase